MAKEKPAKWLLAWRVI